MTVTVEELSEEIARALSGGAPILLCIDGRAGAGKSTLASVLASRFPSRVFHTDDYFSPDGTELLDFSRFASEVAESVRANRDACVRRYDCASGRLGACETVSAQPLTMVEGAFSLHPRALLSPDLSVFVTASLPLRLARIRSRNQDVSAFQSRWIPREEAYFAEFGLPKEQTMILDTTTLSKF